MQGVYKYRECEMHSFLFVAGRKGGMAFWLDGLRYMNRDAGMP